MLKKNTWTRKKIASLILGFFGIGILISCDIIVTNNPLGGKNYMLRGWVTGDIDGDGESEGIPNILVSSNYGVTKTGEYGEYSILGYTLPENVIYELNPSSEKKEERSFIVLEFSDIDGDENGKFKTIKKNFYVDEIDFYSSEDICLERDE